MAALATIADLEALIGRDIITADEPRATRLLELASGVVRGYTRQLITRVVGDAVVLRGDWSSSLALPQKPVESVSQVTIDGVVQAAGTYFLWGSGGRLERRTGAWGGPTNLIGVTYTHGYAVIPDDVIAVVCGLAQSALSNPEGVRSISVDDVSISYGAAPAQALSLAQRKILEPYRLRVTSTPIEREA